MRDYSEQNWREPDPETVATNEAVAVMVALLVGLAIGATFAGFFWS